MNKLLKLFVLFGFARELGINVSFFFLEQGDDPIVTLHFGWPGGQWQVGRSLTQWKTDLPYLFEELQRIIDERQAKIRADFDEERRKIAAIENRQSVALRAFAERQLALFCALGVGSDSECRNREDEQQQQQQNQQNQGQNANQIEP